MKHFFSIIGTGLLLVLLLVGPTVRAQAPAWQMARVITGNQSYVVATATDAGDNIYLTGHFTGTAVFGATTLTSVGVGSDVFVAKWNRTNNGFEWAQRAGGTTADAATAIAVSGVNIYVTGYYSATASFGNIILSGSGGLFVAKLTEAGPTTAFTWARQTGGTGYAIAVNGSSIYVAGRFSSPTITIGSTTLINSGPASPPTSNGFVCKLTDSGSTGSFVWAQGCGGQGCPSALAVNGASIYLTGYFIGTIGLSSTTLTATPSPSISSDVFVAKLTDQGTTSSYVWAQQAGGPGTDEATALVVSGTSVYITGSFLDRASFGNSSLTGPGMFDVFVAKLTDSGPNAAFTWAVQAGGANIEEAHALAVNGSNVYVGGNTGSMSTSFGAATLTHAVNGYFNRDGFVAQLVDSGTSGTFIWAKAGGGDNTDSVNALAISGTSVFGAGYITPPAVFDNIAIPASAGFQIGFLASLTDPTITATTPALNGAAFTLVPNPAHTATTVQLPTLPGSPTATLTLLDALGRRVKTETVALPAVGLLHELSVAGLPAGLYALQVQAGAATATRKLVVE